MKFIRKIGSLAFVSGLFISVFAGVPWAVMAEDATMLPDWLRAAILVMLGGIFLVLLSVVIEEKRGNQNQEIQEAQSYQSKLLLLNSDSVPGKNISEIIGVVKGQTIYAIWIGNDLSAIVRLVLGGELKEYTEMMGNARDIATYRMIKQAEAMGADAIINIRYMTTSVIGSAAELLAYGTAVKLTNQ